MASSEQTSIVSDVRVASPTGVSVSGRHICSSWHGRGGVACSGSGGEEMTKFGVCGDEGIDAGVMADGR